MRRGIEKPRRTAVAVARGCYIRPWAQATLVLHFDERAALTGGAASFFRPSTILVMARAKP